eukprot:Gregarina_sp_Pseudo_9__491@NODE_1311_length_1696_cov_20_599879_g1232_i0_p2_GENE_NODE_1311_length_1696_cov_20_599879_g1232_i0NODE_1311_length_1696_cov_20_599879_g1232_i0_p2_ORF_typecomplete_len178_score51_98Pribosyltran/PF00156_27/1_4e21_NODE_1311_length_1696_cov_20_599879_g1232_i05981131
MEIAAEDKNYVEGCIRHIQDFPKQGVLFRDFMPCIRDPRAFRILVDTLSASVQASGADVIVAPEARGFIFGCPVAYKLGVPLVCARKPGKLPGPVVTETYELEYGQASLEVQAGSVEPGSKVYILDDLLATGGTITALKNLVERYQCQVVRCGFVVELVDFDARKTLGCPIDTIFKF